MEARTLGRAVRALRLHRRWRQADLARVAGVSQPTVSRIERGRLTGLTHGKIDLVLAALDARLVLDLRTSGPPPERLLDEWHARLVAAVASLLTSAGWEVKLELTYAHFGERGSIDILAWHPATRTLLVVEVKTELVSIEGTLRKEDEKTRIAALEARARFG